MRIGSIFFIYEYFMNMVVQYRYEYYSKDGKVFTKWIKLKEFKTKEECNKYISNKPKVYNKLKYEYRCV